MAARRWPGSAPELVLDARIERDRSVLHRGSFTVDGVVHRIVVKTSRAGDRLPSFAPPIAVGAARPRLWPAPGPAPSLRLEAETLDMVEKSLRQERDRRFRPIELVGILEHADGFVMGEIEGPTLRAMLHRLPVTRSHDYGDQIVQAAANAGAWLARYQRIASDLGEPRMSSAAQVADTGARIAGWLAGRASTLGRWGSRRRFETVERVMRLDGPRLLGSNLDLGINHGDYAPRNIIFTSSGGVAVIDGRARWRAPILEDVAAFKVSLRTSLTQAMMGRPWLSAAWLQRIEAAFLGSYFEDRPVPVGALDLYELLMLIDRWSSIEAASASGSLHRRLAAAGLWPRFRSEIDRLLNRIGASASRHDSSRPAS